MKCSDFADWIDDYLDGCLRRPDVEAVRAHLAGCAGCAGEAETARDLRRLAARLPRSLEPPRDLWPEIASRIADEKVVRGRFGRRALMAAAAVVLLAGSIVTAYLVGRGQALTVIDGRRTAASGPSRAVAASFEGLGVDDYAAMRGELLRAFEARRHNLSPETLEVLTTNLKVIDDAMARIAEALDEDPGNEFLMKQLAAIYRRQIDLLETAVRLPAEV